MQRKIKRKGLHRKGKKNETKLSMSGEKNLQRASARMPSSALRRAACSTRCRSVPAVGSAQMLGFTRTPGEAPHPLHSTHPVTASRYRTEGKHRESMENFLQAT